MQISLRRVTTLAQKLVADCLEVGDTAIDATAGTGEDTCFLAKSVGTNGIVYAFDVQQAAIKQTKQKLKQKGLSSQVTLLLDGHEHLENYTEIISKKNIKGIMFNLGYLPNSDEAIITKKETSLQALACSAEMLASGGRMTICLYRHEQSEEECQAIEEWAKKLGHIFDVHRFETINHNNPPYLIVIEKK